MKLSKKLGLSAVFPVIFILISACPDPARQPADRAPAPKAKPSETAPKAKEDTSVVVATIRGEELTLGEVDEHVIEELQKARMEHKQQVYEIRRGGIDRIIAERLFSEEAERLGLDDEDAFIFQAIEKGTPFPSEDEVKAFYDENRHMMGGQPFEQVQARVTQFLHHQKKAERFNSLLDELRKKADITINLPEPRVEVSAEGAGKGPEDAAVTIVEFSDFMCGFCARGREVMNKVHEHYGDKVRIVFRHFPSMENERAVRAASAAVCAEEQGSFWEMHAVLFESKGAVSAEDVQGYASAIEGIDREAFDSCMDSEKTRERLMNDIQAGRSYGVSGTPAFFVNGIAVLGAQPLETFKEIIDRELGENN